MLVALAAMGGMPRDNSVGNVSKVPPPATEFTAPATNAARNNSKNPKAEAVGPFVTRAKALNRVDSMRVVVLPFLPELRLHVADSLVALWESEAREGEPPPPLPFWSSPWLGGQALARYVLDHPEVVRGRRVLDIGTGSGLVAIAAARAGALQVLATDIDARAIEATRLNAATNGVTIEVEQHDVLDSSSDADVILAGDVFYERALAERVLPFLRRHPLALAGDPGRVYFPREGVTLLARYDVPTTVEIEGREVRAAGVYRVERDLSENPPD